MYGLSGFMVFMVLWFMVLWIKTDNTAYQALVLVWLGCGNVRDPNLSSKCYSFLHLEAYIYVPNSFNFRWLINDDIFMNIFTMQNAIMITCGHIFLCYLFTKKWMVKFNLVQPTLVPTGQDKNFIVLLVLHGFQYYRYHTF